ncbi:DNA-binding protein [Rhodanobacter sp. 115]|uniref:DNA-binding protein n=1 Tax=Rhodanobacter sp. FW021-MT20 TaxID=1162282 RepID=UPI0034E44C25
MLNTTDAGAAGRNVPSTHAAVSPTEIARLKAAHPTDTRALVREVANRLFIAGERPTRALVRELTGRGSMTTIDAGLREWWEALRRQLDTRVDVPGIPEALVPAFQTALASLWQQAALEAKGAFDDERAAADTQIQDARAGEAAAHAMVDSVQASLDAAHTELAERGRRIQQLEHELAAARASHESTAAALQRESAGREADRRQADADRREHEAALARVLDERVRERETLEGQLAFTTRQIDEAREKSKGLASELGRERGRAEKAEEAARATARELADERRARDSERATLIAEKADGDRRHEVVLGDLREEMAAANAARQEAAVEVARLRQALDAALQRAADVERRLAEEIAKSAAAARRASSHMVLDKDGEVLFTLPYEPSEDEQKSITQRGWTVTPI